MNTTHRTGRTTLALDPKRVDLADQMRLDRLARELRLTNQILSGDLAEVAVQHGGPAPAWTSLDGEVITFSLDHMPMPSSRLDVAVWLGTNAHELGHVLFSPRADAPLVVRLRSAGEPSLLQLHNIVEDQRQERLILARFAPWRGYLVAALGHHIVADDENAWLLVCGRTWLPAEVRAKAREAFVKGHGETAAVLVASCVGRYQHLADPGHDEADEAWTILEMLLGLLPTPPRLGRMCSTMSEGEPDTSGAEAGAPDTADEADGEVRDGGEGEDSDSDSETGAEGDSDSDSDRAGSGPGPSASRSPIAAEIRDAAAAQLDTADLDAVLDALDHGRGTGGAVGEPPRGHYREVTDAARRLHREVADALLDLHAENEPGWVRRVDAGRLNVGRLANGGDIDQLFDAYQPGHLTANEVEVVVLLDVSTSMSAHLSSVGEATWAIRHAVDDLDGTLTAITWSDGPHRILAAPGERPDDRMFVPAAEGGTDPESALAEAYRLLSTSDCMNRLVVILTDGSWTGNAGRTESIIDAMNDAGIVTVCALLGRAAGAELHRCTFGRCLADLPDLARLFGEVAAARMSQGESY